MSEITGQLRRLREIFQDAQGFDDPQAEICLQASCRIEQLESIGRFLLNLVEEGIEEHKTEYHAYDLLGILDARKVLVSND